jgi:O-antigen/teichoic acid export membrane protein
MSKGIERRAMAGAISGAANFAVSLALTYAVVPLLLSKWGNATYGAWLALMAATALLATADMGHQTFVGNQFNQDVARGVEAVRRNLASGLRITYLLGALQLVVLWLLLKGDLAAQLLGVLPSQVKADRLDIVLFMLVVQWVLVGSASGLLIRLYGPMGLFARSQWLAMVQRLVLQYGVVLAVAMSGGGIFEFGIVYNVVGALFAVWWYLEFRRTLASTYPWWRGGDWKTAWGNFRSSVVLTGNGVLAQASLSAANLMVASLLNAALLPAFTTVRTVANTFLAATSILVQPLVPDMVRFRVNGEWAKLTQTIECAWLAGGAAINVGIVAVAPFVPDLFGWWTRGKLEFSVPLFYLLATAVVVRAAYTPVSSYVSGMNDLRVQLHANLAQATCVIAIPWFLHQRFGLSAFGVGVLAGELAGFAIYARSLLLQREMVESRMARVLCTHALAPMLLVGVAFLASWIWAADAGVITGLAVTALGALHLWQWSRVPPSVQMRLLGVIPLVGSRFVRSP